MGLLALTTLLAVVFPVGSNWVNQAIMLFFWASVYFVFYLLSTGFANGVYHYFYFFYIGGLVQVAWSIVQFVVFFTRGYDINFIVFGKMLSERTSNSYIKDGVFGVSGIAWHPSNMAPLLILVYWMSSNKYMKVLLFTVGVMTNNATVIIGMTLCVVFDVWPYLKRKNFFKSKKTIFGAIVFVVAAMVLVNSDAANMFFNRYTYIYNRTFGGYYDGGSTDAHIRYYTWIPKVFFHFSSLKTFLGFGDGCSGYTISTLRNQYEGIGAWALETDVVNMLWSRGIFGFFVFYSWLRSVAKKGCLINKKYTFVIYIIAFCGVFYSVQYDWVILTELMIDLAIRNNIDIFNMKKIC